MAENDTEMEHTIVFPKNITTVRMWDSELIKAAADRPAFFNSENLGLATLAVLFLLQKPSDIRELDTDRLTTLIEDKILGASCIWEDMTDYSL